MEKTSALLRRSGRICRIAEVFPAGHGKPTVGGTKNARVADVLALRPDLVLCCEEENNRRAVPPFFQRHCRISLREKKKKNHTENPEKKR